MVGRNDSGDDIDVPLVGPKREVEGELVERCFFGQVVENDNTGVNEPGVRQYDGKTFGRTSADDTDALMLSDEVRELKNRIDAQSGNVPDYVSPCVSCDGYRPSCSMYQPHSEAMNPGSRRE